MLMGRKKKCAMKLREKRQAVFNRFARLCAEYGTVRICTVDGAEGQDLLLLFSPVLEVPGDVPCIPAHILDPALWRLAAEAFGDIRSAIAAFSVPTVSCHFTESEQEVK